MNAVVEHKEQPPTERPDQEVSFLAVLERVALDPNIDVEKMERLLSMAERVRGREAEQKFAAALNEVQRKTSTIGADAENPQTRSRYASYEKLDRILRPIYTDAGFSLQFGTAAIDAPDIVRVTCTVTHEAGHSRTVFIDMPADGKGAKGGDVMTKTHAAGSAISYGMRYLLKMIFNVAVGEHDDDGNSAGVEYITESQAADLRALAEEVKADMPRFLKYLRVPEVGRIPAAKYKDAIAALEKKRRRA